MAVGRAQSQIQCSSRIKATNRSSANLFSLVSLGIFAHGASHFSPICTTIFDGITPGQVSRRYMRMPVAIKAIPARQISNQQQRGRLVVGSSATCTFDICHQEKRVWRQTSPPPLADPPRPTASVPIRIPRCRKEALSRDSESSLSAAPGRQDPGQGLGQGQGQGLPSDSQ